MSNDSLPWIPAKRYVVLAPQLRLAQDILRYDHKIEPRMPILWFTHNPDNMRGIRNTPALVIDPSSRFRERDLYLIGELRHRNIIQDWTEEDFAYLRDLTRRGPE